MCNNPKNKSKRLHKNTRIDNKDHSNDEHFLKGKRNSAEADSRA